MLASRAEAQVDPSGSWRTLHTPHFRIHFLPAYRAVALAEAREAERSYRLLATELHPPRGVVDITLADDVDAANGFTSVVPTNRITIFAAPPAGDHGLLFFDSWLRLVTTHELAHVFHLDRTKGIWSALQTVFGRAPGLFPNEYQPSWVVEGLATYYESRFTNGGRVRGSFHTQLLEADQTAGASRSPWDAMLFTRWAGGLVPYAYGSRFLHYLAGAAGDSVVPRFVEATAAQLIPFRVGRQVSRVAAGRSLAGEWRRGTEPVPRPGATAVRPLVVDSLLRSEPIPRVSPDGRRVAYVRDDGKGASEVRVLDAVSLRTLATRQVNGGVDYDWVGDTLGVAQLDFTSRWRIRSDLYRWVPTNGTWRRATHGARLVAPTGGGGRLTAITLGPASARPTVPAPGDSSDAVWTDVASSPDGRWVAGIRCHDGRWSLVLWPAVSPADAVALLDTRGSIADVVWTSDGDLWFVAEPTGLPQVYRWTDSAGVRPVTAEPLGARAPAPLADGAVLYAGLTARGWELRRTSPAVRGGPVTFPDPLPFDSAPGVAVRETGYSSWPSLRPSFWLPAFDNEGPTGRFGGALTAGTDAVGRYAYAFDLLYSLEPSRLAGDFALVSARFGNPVLDLSVSSSWDDLGPLTAPAVTLSELDQSAAFGASFVTRRWRGVTGLRIAAEVERTDFASIPESSLATVCSGCGRLDLYGGSATLTLTRLVTGALSVSPEDGVAWSGTYRRREERGQGGGWSNELRSRLALYAHVPGVGGFAHHVVAVRLLGGATNGPLAPVFRVGGVTPQGVNFFFPPSLSATRAFPVRGYADGEVRGERAVAGSVEYRLPLALVGRGIGHLPFGVDRLWMNVFSDAGDAWAPGTAPRLTRLWSTGLEVAGVVTVFYDYPLSVRLGIAEPLADPPSGTARRAQVYVALSSDF